MAQKSTQHCRNKSAIESSFGESLKNIAQKSGLGKNTPIRTMNGTSAPPKEPEQDLTVVKQIKHLGLQKQSSKILVEGLVVVENRLEARKKERNLRKDPKVLQGANKLLDLQKQSSLEMSTKPLDVESKVEVREQERVPRKKTKRIDCFARSWQFIKLRPGFTKPAKIGWVGFAREEIYFNLRRSQPSYSAKSKS